MRVTTQRPLRSDPSGSRPLSASAAAPRSGRGIALAALVIAVAALGLAGWRALVPAGSPCQAAAWAVVPPAADLPAGWTVASSQYDVERKSLSLLGPPPEDETVAQAVVYATITCYPTGAEDAVARSADASTAAGQLLTARDDLGDQGFSAVDSSGAIFLQFRHGAIVVYLAASGEANETEVDELASLFDKALGGDGGAVAVTSPAVSTVPDPTDVVEPASADPGSSADASAAPAPELEALLPAEVAGIALTVDSATGDMVLGEDQGSRAIAATLRAAGRTPLDLHVAQAFDETQQSDLSILAIGVAGMTDAQVKAMVLESWLSATGTGVTIAPATVGGRPVDRVDYGDAGTKDYVLVGDGVVFVVTTANPDLAAGALAALP